jgi:hypothetical protein
MVDSDKSGSKMDRRRYFLAGMEPRGVFIEEPPGNCFLQKDGGILESLIPF